MNAHADVDPGRPSGDAEVSQDVIKESNFGFDGAGDLPAGERLEDIVPSFAVTSTDFSVSKASNFLSACINAHPRVTYGLGKKISAGQKPGSGFTQVDCSGFVRELMRQATNLGGSFPDGSVVQHDWVVKKGYAPDTVASGTTKDSNVRIAFLSPNSTSSGIGHVVLIYQGKTFESHGGIGPDSRTWDGSAWQAKTKVYIFGSAI